jgi:hypothetical protein
MIRRRKQALTTGVVRGARDIKRVTRQNPIEAFSLDVLFPERYHSDIKTSTC